MRSHQPAQIGQVSVPALAVEQGGAELRLRIARVSEGWATLQVAAARVKFSVRHIARK
jgi:hypothetical protein